MYTGKIILDTVDLHFKEHLNSMLKILFILKAVGVAIQSDLLNSSLKDARFCNELTGVTN